MEKYRLKKLYPGSPKLDTEIFNDGILKGHYYKYINGIKTHIGTIEPYKYPEFWEKVVEKDYEILSFKSKTDIEQYRVLDTDTGLYKYFHSGVKSKYSKEYLIQKGSYKIHSVKRLSDGEVFTVGDKVDSTISDLGRTTDITGFKIMNNELKVGLRHLGYYPLSTIILPKNPLFITEDGVEIFEGDKFIPVCIKDGYGFEPYGILNQIWSKVAGDDHAFKYFSTKEAAKEFVLMNKPCLSINEVMNITYNPTETFTSTSNKLKEIVKSKL